MHSYRSFYEADLVEPYFLHWLMIACTFFVSAISQSYFFSAITSLLTNLLPIPTAQTPALNQPSIFSLVVSTPPVGMNKSLGKISFIVVKNSGPNKLPG